MRILLAYPPLSAATEVMPPLGLCTLAAWLRGHGHEVRIVDLDLEVKLRAGRPERSFIEILLRAVDEYQPEAAGFTSMYSNSLQAEQMIAATRRHKPDIVTIAGGSHFGALSSQALKRIRELDFAIEGEGEVAFLELIEALERGTPSDIPRVHARNRSVLGAPRLSLLDLAALPPVWSSLSGAVDLSRYAATIPGNAARRMIYIEAGRGCPFACKFCATAPFWQQKYRVKPPAHIVDEIRFLHQTYGYDSFILVHDLLTANQKFISEFCDEMMAAALPVEWMANSRTDIPLHGLLPKMKASGCWKLFFGLESASERLQASFDKHLSLAEAGRHLRDLSHHGIGATCSFIFGFPDETVAETSSTIAMAARTKLLGVETVQMHRLRLFPPSRYCRENLSGEFDFESLRIEYPFLEVTRDAIATIREDREFFGGYFTLSSPVGAPDQLAQIEMFFHHAIALAPLTVAALDVTGTGDSLSSFYAALAETGPIDRGSLDWDSGNLFANWCAIRPLLSAWSSAHLVPGSWESRIVRELVSYEERRLTFVSAQPYREEPLAQGARWAAFPCGLDLNAVVERLTKGAALDKGLLRSGAVVFSWDAGGGPSAFQLEDWLLPDLVRGEAELIASFAA